ncbi:hypothetical protein L1887_56604 [Cichorium endivia]|nr:hypothetical protein L1887_56604 [Cichorium endivia]
MVVESEARSMGANPRGPCMTRASAPAQSRMKLRLSGESQPSQAKLPSGQGCDCRGPIPIPNRPKRKAGRKARCRSAAVLWTWPMRALELRPHSKVEGKAAKAWIRRYLFPPPSPPRSAPTDPSVFAPHHATTIGIYAAPDLGGGPLPVLLCRASVSCGYAHVCYPIRRSFALLNKPYIQRALMDENVQYLFLAVYWFMSKPIFITILPFVTFSLFHVLTFVRTTILPAVFPTPTPPAQGAAQGATQQQSKLARMVQGWVKANYDPAMRFVAYAEVAIFARVLFGALLWRNSLMAPLFYAHFLRLRFYMSSFTRAAFQHVGAVLDGYTQHQSCPPGVRKVYLTLTDLVARYASSVLSVQNNQAQQNQQPQQAAPQQPAARR